jgi:hypothetical protein
VEYQPAQQKVYGLPVFAHQLLASVALPLPSSLPA